MAKKKTTKKIVKKTTKKVAKKATAKRTPITVSSKKSTKKKSKKKENTLRTKINKTEGKPLNASLLKSFKYLHHKDEIKSSDCRVGYHGMCGIHGGQIATVYNNSRTTGHQITVANIVNGQTVSNLAYYLAPFTYQDLGCAENGVSWIVTSER